MVKHIPGVTNVVNNITFYIVHAKCEKALLSIALAFDDTNRVSYILITPLSPLSRNEIEQRAALVASDFFQEKFDQVFSQFDESLRSQLPAERLQPVFTQVTNSAGNFDHIVSKTKNPYLDFVDVVCQMQGGRTNLRVAFDPDMRINTFLIAPAK